MASTLGYGRYCSSAGLPPCVFLTLVFSGDRPGRGATRSYGSSIFNGKRTAILFSLPAVTSLGATRSYWVHSFLKPLQHSCFEDYFAVNHSDGCEVNVVVDWICMALFVPDVEHFPMHSF